MSANFLKYVILPIILLFAVLIMIFKVLVPLYGLINNAVEAVEQNKINLAERKKVAINLEKLLGQYNERATEITSFNKAVPVGQSVAEAIINLEALASENGLVFLESSFKSKDSTGVGGIKTLIANIRVKGSYTAFKNYLKSLEKNLRIVDIIKISFSSEISAQAGYTTDNVTFDLTANTYYR